MAQVQAGPAQVQAVQVRAQAVQVQAQAVQVQAARGLEADHRQHPSSEDLAADLAPVAQHAAAADLAPAAQHAAEALVVVLELSTQRRISRR